MENILCKTIFFCSKNFQQPAATNLKAIYSPNDNNYLALHSALLVKVSSLDFQNVKKVQKYLLNINHISK